MNSLVLKFKDIVIFFSENFPNYFNETICKARFIVWNNQRHISIHDIDFYYVLIRRDSANNFHK